MCSPSNTGLQFTTYDDGGFYFRTAPPDNLQAQVLADLIVGDGHAEGRRRGAAATSTARASRTLLKEELEAAGATVTGDPILYDPEAGELPGRGRADRRRRARRRRDDRVRRGRPGAQAAIAAGDRSRTTCSGTAPTASRAAPSSRRSTPTTRPSSRASGARRRRRRRPTVRRRSGSGSRRSHPGVDTIFSGHAYDCVVVAALAAIAAEAAMRPQTIQAGINDVTNEGEKCTPVRRVRRAARRDGDADIDYDGAAGPLDFVEAGEPGAGAYDTWTFDADGAVTVDRREHPASRERRATHARRGPGAAGAAASAHPRSGSRGAGCRGRARRPSGRPAARRPCPCRRRGPGRARSRGRRSRRHRRAFCSTITTETPAAVDLDDALEHLVLEQRREAGRRLVEEQHRRLHHQRPRHRDHLALAARQRARPLAAPLARAAGTARTTASSRSSKRLGLRGTTPMRRFSSTVSSGTRCRAGGRSRRRARRARARAGS